MDFDQLVILQESENEDTRRRAMCILLHLRDGLSMDDISEKAGISRRSVERYVRQYKKQGISACTRRSPGRTLSSPLLQQLAVESPLAHGYLLERWTPDMLSQETGASYDACRRILEKMGRLGSLQDAFLEIGDNVRLATELRKRSKAGEQLWIVDNFLLGDDRGRKRPGLIDYLKRFYCYYAVSLSESDFIVDVQGISARSEDQDTPKSRHIKRYASFLSRTCDYVLRQFDAPTLILLYWTPDSRSVLPLVKSEAQAKKQTSQRSNDRRKTTDMKSTALARYLPGQSHPLRHEITEFETFLKRELESLKIVDGEAVCQLRKLAYEWWKQNHPISDSISQT